MAINETFPFALPNGTILAGQYIIQNTLGQGGFGITYKVREYKSGRIFAIKEYFPETLSYRKSNYVFPYPGERGENYLYGRKLFLKEAETLARFIDNSGVVRIYSYFEENGTAYFVMDYIEGMSFDVFIKQQGGRISVMDAQRVVVPVMDALASVHKKGIIHRDVTPDNICIKRNGKVILLDFGAARYSLGDKSRSLDIILKPGFAPKEQYSRKSKQGPYTDVYSLGATFYFAIAGMRPPDSFERIEDDELVPPHELGINISKSKEDAILKALSIRSADRFQTMGEFKSALLQDERIESVEKIKRNHRSYISFIEKQKNKSEPLSKPRSQTVLPNEDPKPKSQISMPVEEQKEKSEPLPKPKSQIALPVEEQKEKSEPLPKPKSQISMSVEQPKEKSEPLPKPKSLIALPVEEQKEKSESLPKPKSQISMPVEEPKEKSEPLPKPKSLIALPVEEPKQKSEPLPKPKSQISMPVEQPKEKRESLPKPKSQTALPVEEPKQKSETLPKPKSQTALPVEEPKQKSEPLQMPKSQTALPVEEPKQKSEPLPKPKSQTVLPVKEFKQKLQTAFSVIPETAIKPETKPKTYTTLSGIPGATDNIFVEIDPDDEMFDNNETITPKAAKREPGVFEIEVLNKNERAKTKFMTRQTGIVILWLAAVVIIVSMVVGIGIYITDTQPYKDEVYDSDIDYISYIIKKSNSRTNSYAGEESFEEESETDRYTDEYWFMYEDSESYWDDSEYWVEDYYSEEDDEIDTDIPPSPREKEKTKLIAEGNCGQSNEYYDNESESGPSDNVKWAFYESGTLYIYGKGYMWDYDASLGSNSGYVSYENNVKKVVVEYGVKSIGAGAFSWFTNLSDIEIADSVRTICSDSFNSCISLSSLEIPESVTTILSNAFCYCNGLTNVNIPANVTYIGSGVFRECDNLSEIKVDSNNKSYKSEDGVLYDKNMTELIAYPAGKKAEKFTVPANIAEIADGMFCDCKSIKSIDVDNKNKYYSSQDGVLFNKDKTILMAYPAGNPLSAYKMPDSVTEIGYCAFFDCDNLIDITFSAKLTSIESSAFAECDGFSAVNIPGNVVSIGRYAFNRCSKLTSIDVDSQNKYYSSKDEVLFNKDMSKLILYPQSKNDKTYIIPDSVKEIDLSAFRGSTYLEKVVISKNVTNIGSYSFMYCDSLTLVEISKSVTDIGYAAFYQCTDLTAVCYTGSEKEWKKVTVGANNESLTSAVMHYDSNINI